MDRSPGVASLPAMPLERWVDTKDTLHRWLQIVGKIRLAAGPPRNHWWHVPFHVTGRGITTRPMGFDPVFTIDFDFVDHRLLIHTTAGRTVSFPLSGQSVAAFYEHTVRALGDLGIELVINRPEPFDLSDSTPFEHDTAHATYDPVWATRYWQVLSHVSLILEEFAGGFSGKTSPVHHFWHTFDIAVTRFSDREVVLPATADAVTREAYSRELISFGFWFGDDSFPEPAFYSYTAPEPDGLASEPLRPAGAEWLARDTGHLAVYRYEDARAAGDVRAPVLAFYDSAYRAGATRAGWDIARYRAPGGATAQPP
jgi:hypothetical protein